MEHDATEVKQTPAGDGQVGDESREAGEKSEETKAEQLKPSDAKQLIQFMEKKYEQHVANVQSFDEFYHAIFELIEMFCEERGQLQYRIPEKEKLLQAYKKHHGAAEDGQQVKKEEFVRISREVIRPESFTFGKATAEFMMWLFGAPMCAVVAKRVLPGLGWLSDDLLIPLATSGSVAYLVHSKKL